MLRQAWRGLVLASRASCHVNGDLLSHRVSPAYCRTSLCSNYSTLLDTAAVPDDLFRSIELEIRGHDPAVLTSYVNFLTASADNLQVQLEILPTSAKPIYWKWVALKSAHVHKKHKVHYETRTYLRKVLLHKLTGSTADTYLEYVQRNLPEGVAMKVTKQTIGPFPDFIQQEMNEPNVENQ